MENSSGSEKTRLPIGDELQATIAQLNMLQANIARMANNSFMVKGWSISLVSGLLAFAAQSKVPAIAWGALLPCIMFWGLDAFFLGAEWYFRTKDKEVRGDTVFNFDLKRSMVDKHGFWTAVFSKTLIPFHGIMLVSTIAVSFALSIQFNWQLIVPPSNKPESSLQKRQLKELGRGPFLEREAKRAMELVRFKVANSGIRTIHPGAPVVNKKGACIGYVTSAALVGTRQLGLAWVKRQYVDVGTDIGISRFPKKGEYETNLAE